MEYRIAYLTEDVTKDQLLTFIANCVWFEVEMTFADGERWLIAETDNEQIYKKLCQLKDDHQPHLAKHEEYIDSMRKHVYKHSK